MCAHCLLTDRAAAAQKEKGRIEAPVSGLIEKLLPLSLSPSSFPPRISLLCIFCSFSALASDRPQKFIRDSGLLGSLSCLPFGAEFLSPCSLFPLSLLSLSSLSSLSSHLLSLARRPFQGKKWLLLLRQQKPNITTRFLPD